MTGSRSESQWESPRRLDQPADWSRENTGRQMFDDVLAVIKRYPFMPLVVGVVAGFFTGECLASCMSSRD
jgi:hypothetical protein